MFIIPKNSEHDKGRVPTVRENPLGRIDEFFGKKFPAGKYQGIFIDKEKSGNLKLRFWLCRDGFDDCRSFPRRDFFPHCTA